MMLTTSLIVIETRRRTKVAGRKGQDGGEDQSTSGQGLGASLFEEKGRGGKEKATKGSSSKHAKLNATQLRELELKKEKEATQSYHRVKTLWARMLAGETEAHREWMYEAESLVESFRETRALFLSTRVSVGNDLNASLLTRLYGTEHRIPRGVSAVWEEEARC
jgi:general transcription factor 3C polypeptide 3 (transcription factor C subunit 4)